MRTPYEAGKRLAERSALDFDDAYAVLCEDGRTVMIYLEAGGETFAECFELSPGEQFNADVAVFSVLFAAHLTKDPIVVPQIAKAVS